MMNDEFRDSVEEHAAQILSRFSVFDLREISGEEMERAEARYLRSEGFIGLVNSGERNMIGWFASGRWPRGQKENKIRDTPIRNILVLFMCGIYVIANVL
jgi:hypothetical protein